MTFLENQASQTERQADGTPLRTAYGLASGVRWTAATRPTHHARARDPRRQPHSLLHIPDTSEIITILSHLVTVSVSILSYR